MRLNTGPRYRNFVFIYIMLFLALAFDLFIVAGDAMGDNPGSIFKTEFRMGYLVLAISIFMIYRGNPVFLYDSDGEVIILESKNPSFAFLSRVFVQHYEFPKRKLVDYKIESMPFRRKMVLTVSSKNETRKHVVVSCSYINKQEVKDLERSLRGILSKNKKAGYLDEGYDDGQA